jgi:hypothetical protein
MMCFIACNEIESFVLTLLGYTVPYASEFGLHNSIHSKTIKIDD